ncbi:MAG: alpha-amylase [Clostridia bacterium]|nr:alpha-amylase [Clostridia bacterium]
MKQINGTMIQYFEWYLDSKKGLWNQIIEEAEILADLGITAAWLPPAYKGIGGENDVGYGVYDLYDLGEFNQKGSIKTKYGTRDEYLRAIESLKQNGINVYADIVLNHKMGADREQEIPANRCEWENHNIAKEQIERIKVDTKFIFPGRNNKYSDFKWNWTHFTGMDYDKRNGEKALFKFQDKEWNNLVDEEFENFDYLMGADLDFNNKEVVEECKRWGLWYQKLTRVDGFRLDAVKHIDATFYKEWVQYMRKSTNKELFTVGEYWSYDVEKLHRYITQTEGLISLFDVPLHYNFYKAGTEENYDMTKILTKTLTSENSYKSVTFVDNHDTQPGQALQSFVPEWFKQTAYAIILLRNEGYPCVFYGDLYGIPHNNIKPVERIKTLLYLRKVKAYGLQHDYFDYNSTIGWTREGDDNHPNSGLAVISSNTVESIKRMYIGKHFAGEKFIDALDNCPDIITIDDEGCGIFKTKGKSTSVWVKK